MLNLIRIEWQTDVAITTLSWNGIDRPRLVDAYTGSGDCQVLARQLGVARQTARNVVIWFRQRGDINLRARGGAHNIKIDVEMGLYLLRKMEIKVQRLTNPDVQLKIFDREAPRNETLHNRRMQVLTWEIEGSILVITLEKCTRFMNRVLTYVLRCLHREAILD